MNKQLLCKIVVSLMLTALVGILGLVADNYAIDFLSHDHQIAVTIFTVFVVLIGLGVTGFARLP